MGEGSGSETKVSGLLFEGEAAFSWLEPAAAAAPEGRARLVLDEEHCTLAPESGAARVIPYREIMTIEPADYRVVLHLSSGERLLLHRLGYAYEDFLRLLFKQRGVMLLKDMLMHEKVLRDGFEASYACYGASGELRGEGRCEPRLYETALVVIPEQEDPLRFPYSEMENLSIADHTLILTNEYGEKVHFSRMGYNLEGFKEQLAAAINRLEERTQQLVQQLLPGANPAETWQLARLMREGRAASRSEIDAVSPLFWPVLEQKVEQSAIKEEYRYLKSLARPEHMAMGIKRGLMGELSGDYVWFLIPVYSSDPKQPGNALIMESFSEQGTAQATYLFRIVARDIYAGGTADLKAETEQMLRRVNRCMLAVNFRREPVYLPEDKLSEPQYLRYLYALRRLPALAELRERFIGRVPHTSLEQWQQSITALLASNVGDTGAGP